MALFSQIRLSPFLISPAPPALAEARGSLDSRAISRAGADGERSGLQEGVEGAIQTPWTDKEISTHASDEKVILSDIASIKIGNTWRMRFSVDQPSCFT